MNRSLLAMTINFVTPLLEFLDTPWKPALENGPLRDVSKSR